MGQSLDSIVKVNVTVSPMAQSAGTFDVGLIVGTSTVISKADRVKIYTSTADMLAAGWTGSEPEYLAAQLYFSQDPSPSKVVVGAWDKAGSETDVQAIQACRGANGDWYGCYVVGAAKDDIEAIAPVVEALEPFSCFFYDTKDADVLAGTAGNVLDTLKDANYDRSIGIYSTVDYAGAALMGRAMGLNTGAANSAFTLAYKDLKGVAPEPVNTTQLNYILSVNGNVYTTYGANYKLLVQGTVASGRHFDEILDLDMLAAGIQIGVMNSLTGAPSKIPQTEDGLSLLLDAIETECEAAVTRGALAPGVWNAAPVLTLQKGDVLTKGYLVLAESMASQSQTDREARKAPPIYVPVKMAGAIEHAVINVIVNR